MLQLRQHHSWKVFVGESTDDQNMVAVLEPSHMAIFGKTVRIKRPGQEEPIMTVKVRLRPAKTPRCCTCWQ